MPRTREHRRDGRRDELTNQKLEKLVSDICHSKDQDEEEARATALLILADELEQEGGLSEASMAVKRAAFALCNDECLEAQVDLVRTEYRYS